MIKKTTRELGSTSFYDVKVRATLTELIQALGEPTHNTPSGDNKVQKSWNCETADDIFFTIYDWKKYRQLEQDEIIDWHIGGYDFLSTLIAASDLEDLLNSMR